MGTGAMRRMKRGSMYGYQYKKKFKTMNFGKLNYQQKLQLELMSTVLGSFFLRTSAKLRNGIAELGHVIKGDK